MVGLLLWNASRSSHRGYGQEQEARDGEGSIRIQQFCNSLATLGGFMRAVQSCGKAWSLFLKVSDALDGVLMELE